MVGNPGCLESSALMGHEPSAPLPVARTRLDPRAGDGAAQSVGSTRTS
jgi:hypothetical protein